MTGARPTPAELRLRETVEEVCAELGSLSQAYDESRAIRVIKALGNCDAFIAPSLNYLHTRDQEKARADFHQACERLSGAIRQAVGHPSVERREQVVHEAQALGRAAEHLRAAFDWPEP